MPFLNQISHRKTVMAEAGSKRDDEAHMRCGQLVKSNFVALFLPAHGKQMLLFSFEKRGIHGGANETTTNA